MQLIKDVRVPMAATTKHPQRVDYEYRRNGTACFFLFAEPLAGYRHVVARPRRTKVDWAQDGTMARYALRPLPENHLGDGQSQYAHQGGILGSVCT